MGDVGDSIVIDVCVKVEYFFRTGTIWRVSSTDIQWRRPSKANVPAFYELRRTNRFSMSVSIRNGSSVVGVDCTGWWTCSG